MDERHRELRSKLHGMTQQRAIAHIEAYGLLEDEEFSLVFCDARRKSCQQAADALHTSVDNVYKIRSRAYRKMVSAEE